MTLEEIRQEKMRVYKRKQELQQVVRMFEEERQRHLNQAEEARNKKVENQGALLRVEEEENYWAAKEQEFLQKEKEEVPSVDPKKEGNGKNVHRLKS
jgi:hypothetical protein